MWGVPKRYFYSLWKLSMKFQKGTFVLLPNKNQLRGLSPLIQTLYVWLVNYASEDGVCFPSIEKLSTDCGMSKNSVLRSIEVLENARFLTRTRRGNVGMSNRYQLNILPEKVNGGAPQRRGGAPQRPRGVPHREPNSIQWTQVLPYPTSSEENIYDLE